MKRHLAAGLAVLLTIPASGCAATASPPDGTPSRAGLNVVLPAPAAGTPVEPLPVAGTYVNVVTSTPTGMEASSLTGRPPANAGWTARVSGLLTGAFTPAIETTGGTMMAASLSYLTPTTLVTPLANEGPSQDSLLSSSDYVRAYSQTYEDAGSNARFTAYSVIGLRPAALPATGSISVRGTQQVRAFASVHGTGGASNPQAFTELILGTNVITADFSRGTVDIDIRALPFQLPPGGIGPFQPFPGGATFGPNRSSGLIIRNLKINRETRGFYTQPTGTIANPNDRTTFTTNIRSTTNAPLDFTTTGANAQGYFYGDPQGSRVSQIGGYFDISGPDGSLYGIFIAN